MYYIKLHDANHNNTLILLFESIFKWDTTTSKCSFFYLYQHIIQYRYLSS